MKQLKSCDRKQLKSGDRKQFFFLPLSCVESVSNLILAFFICFTTLNVIITLDDITEVMINFM